MAPRRIFIGVLIAVVSVGQGLFLSADDGGGRPAPAERPAVDAVAPSGGGTVAGDPCALTGGCGVQANTPNQCRWSQFRANCDSPGISPVDKRLCRLGVFLDGDLADGLGGGGSCELVADTGPYDPNIFQAERAVAFFDRFGSVGAPDPGPFGEAEQPLNPGEPSGFNVGCSLLWFAPDDNPNDGQDTSFLYVAWDLAEDVAQVFSGPPVPYDADADGSACSTTRFLQVSDLANEFYEVSLQACANLGNYNANSGDPNGAFVLSDVRATMVENNPSPLLINVLPDDQGSLRTDVLVRLTDVALSQVFGVETIAFPTADAINTNGTGNPNATNRRDSCVQQELESCEGQCSTNRRCSGNGLTGALCTTNADCAPGERCTGAPCCTGGGCPPCPAGGSCIVADDHNNVEFVIKKVETSGILGPHTGRVCSGSGKACRSVSQCPNGQSCVVSAIASDSAKALDNRIALSTLIAVLRADTDADSGFGSEELASVAQAVSVPGLEVTKKVRCAESGETQFSQGPVEALLGSFVEFEITVENTGNIDLAVTMSDVLKDVAPSLAQCEVACGTCTVGGRPCVTDADCTAGTCNLGAAPFEAFLTSPERSLNNFAVNTGNALGLQLEPNFYQPQCSAPGVSFLESVKDKLSAPLGTLLGRNAARVDVCSKTGAACTVDADCAATNSGTCDPVCSVGLGDKLVLRFKARMGQKNATFCDNRLETDCENSVSVEGKLPGGGITVIAADYTRECFSNGLSCNSDADCTKACSKSLTTCTTNGQCPVGETCLGCQTHSDQITTIDVVCRDLEFLKTVGLPGDEGSFVTGLTELNLSGGGGEPPPPGESCCEVHNSPGCSDAACQAIICGIDPFCCGQDAQHTGTWDSTCVTSANALCAGCQLTASVESGASERGTNKVNTDRAGEGVRDVEDGVRGAEIAAGAPVVTIEYRYKATNTGEVKEDITIEDARLCADIVAVNFATPGAIAIDAVGCPICPSGSVLTAAVPPGGMATSKCQMAFADLQAIRDFIARDDGTAGAADRTCAGVADILSGSEQDVSCYRNCASATGNANATDVDSICRPPVPPNTVQSFTTVCNRTCELKVCKQVRCLPNCVPPTDAEAGWRFAKVCSGDANRCCDENGDCENGQTCNTQPLLDVTPGACVQYRIKVTNVSPSVDLCALKFSDFMSPKDEFVSGPTSVAMIGRSCTNVNFGTAFNWDGVDVDCLLNSPLAHGVNDQPGDSLSVTFIGQLEASDGTADLNQTNTITVSGASPSSDDSCPTTVDALRFDCSDSDAVSIDVKECTGTLDKDVTCDEPLLNGNINNGANWQETNVEALPGSEVAFRIELTNNGEATWTTINITDTLSGFCDPTWYVPSSVRCEIGAVDVTGCICLSPAGNCDDIADLNGTKNLDSAACTNGLAQGETLRCTLKLKVPAGYMQLNTAEDCRNTIRVEPNVGICRGTTNPCAALDSFATVNVRVPKIECDKLTCPDVGANNAPNTCDVGTTFGATFDVCVADANAPLRVIYKYSAINTGEVPYASSKVCDPDLRADILANVGVTTTCAFDGSGCIPADPATGMATCSVTFPNFAAWQAFAAKDGNVQGRERLCYDNAATAMANLNVGALCSRGAVTSVSSSDLCSAEACFQPPCSLHVCKEVRCLPECSATGLDAEEGWYRAKACSGDANRCCDSAADCDAGQTCNVQPLLEIAPGACLEYRIKVSNNSLLGVSIPSMTVTDSMANKSVFASVPTNVVLPAGVNCVPPFNVDGTPSVCQFAGGDPLEVGETAVIRFRGELKSPAELDAAAPDPVNTVTVAGTSSCANTNTTCPDTSSVGVDIKRCNFTVTKDVTCDDPRLPNPSFDPGVQDVLPGSEVAFKIQICNTGEIKLPKVTITDEFVKHPAAPSGVSCNWPLVAGSVKADIGGVDVTSCVCPPGGCPSISAMNGMKVFDDEGAGADCFPGGLIPGQCLTLTFALDVPGSFSNKNTAVDCQNNVTVSVVPSGSVCIQSSDNPCRNPKSDSVDVNVLVPEIACDKCVYIESIGEGTCARVLEVSGGESFPMTLVYRVIVHNNGETDLKNVKVTDAELVADAGLNLGACDLSPAGAMIANISKMSDAAAVYCRLTFTTPEELEAFFLKDGGREDAYVNTVDVVGEPSVPVSGPTRVCPSETDYSSQCTAEVSRPRERCDCPCTPVTKAKFDIFNENESKFSGTERCIESWDERLLSEYSLNDEGNEIGIPNYFWRTVLGTDKGMARINGVASRVVCGEGSVDAPLIGVASKIVYFDNNMLDRTGMNLVGVGAEAGQLLYETREPSTDEPPQEELVDEHDTTVNVPKELWDSDMRFGTDDGGQGGTIERSALDPNAPVGGIAQKGSLLAFTKVRAAWNSSGQIIEDTFIDIANDGTNDVTVQAYLVNGDLCAIVDRSFTLTKNQPAFWSAARIDPVYGPSLPELFDQCPDLRDDNHDDRPDNPGGRIARGYLVLWAVDTASLQEIRWNHLKGDALMVNYRDGAAWEYEAWAFRAVAGTRSGDPLLAPFGQLDLNAVEYDAAPDTLLLDFYASGATLGRSPGPMATVDTDLTLWAVLKNLRHDAPVPDCSDESGPMGH